MREQHTTRAAVLAVISGLVLWGVTGWTSTAATAAEAEAVPLLEDRHFQNGFRVLDPAPGQRVVVGTLAGLGDGEPAWDLPQWHSRYDIEGTDPQRHGSEAMTYQDPGKQVILGRPGTAEADLTLAVHGSAEYDEPKGREDAWPHLYASQRIESELSLAEIESLPFHVEARLRHSEMHQSEESYAPQVHAAQYLLFFTVQNHNRDSTGYGDYVWFGVPIYDNRHEMYPGYVAMDSDRENKQGTGKLIYTVPQDQFTDVSLDTGEWVRFEADLKPLMMEAVEEAWERGALGGAEDLNDFHIGGITLGWEMPGVFDASVQIRDLRVHAYPQGQQAE